MRQFSIYKMDETAALAACFSPASRLAAAIELAGITLPMALYSVRNRNTNQLQGEKEILKLNYCF